MSCTGNTVPYTYESFVGGTGQGCRKMQFFERPLNVGLISGAGGLGGLVVIPVLLKMFKFF